MHQRMDEKDLKEDLGFYSYDAFLRVGPLCHASEVSAQIDVTRRCLLSIHLTEPFFLLRSVS